jgi:hypothetical protein
MDPQVCLQPALQSLTALCHGDQTASNAIWNAQKSELKIISYQSMRIAHIELIQNWQFRAFPSPAEASRSPRHAFKAKD